MKAYLPELNLERVSAWSETDRTMYNQLDYYFAKVQVEHFKQWNIWAKKCKQVRWTPNQGTEMRGVRLEPSPFQRQFAFPNAIANLPGKDVININETLVSAVLYRHNFESRIFSWQNNFQDWINDHINPTLEDMNQKIEYYNDVFIRGYMFHQAPHIYLPDSTHEDGAFLTAPSGVGNEAGTAAKSTAFLTGMFPFIGNPGNLSFSAIFDLLNIMENDLRVPYYSGAGRPSQDAGMDGNYLLTCSSEAWNQFLFDPWVSANKPIDMNLVTGRLRGKFWGRITTEIESLPIRIAADGSFPYPQTLEGNADAYNYGETVSNPAYNNAPFEVAWLSGQNGYDAISVGPPPKPFAGNIQPKNLSGMNWNGKVCLTDEILIPTGNANTPYELNRYKEKLQLISQAVYGCLPKQRRNIVPIIFKRVRGLKQVAG